VPDAYFKRELVISVHAAQLVHEREHVLDGIFRQVPDAHEPPGADFGEAGNATRLDSVKLAHGCPSVGAGSAAQ
jgi:hypothetical protein